MSLLDLMQQQIGADAIDTISRQVGAGRQATAATVSAALPLLLTSLARNSADPEGARSLSGALERDHDGSVLDDVAGFLGRAGTSPGEGILRHALGSRQGNAEVALGQMSGLDAQKVSQILALLAPIVLGALGRERRQRNLDPGGLGDLLGRERRRVERAEPGLGGIFGQILDRDRDGKVGDDLAKIGVGMLGRMFSGR